MERKEKSKGKKKIEMKIIPEYEARQVTFSKRKSGLFKKASELSTLCGVDIAILVFSPGGKPFSFGNPSFESVMNRFLNQILLGINGSVLKMAQTQKETRVLEHNQQLDELVNQLEIEKKKEAALIKKNEKRVKSGWEAPIDNLSFHDLKQLLTVMANFMKKVDAQVKKLRAQNVAAASSFPILPDESIQAANPFITGATQANAYLVPDQTHGFGYGPRHF